MSENYSKLSHFVIIVSEDFFEETYLSDFIVECQISTIEKILFKGGAF